MIGLRTAAVERFVQFCLVCPDQKHVKGAFLWKMNISMAFPTPQSVGKRFETLKNI
jgi:hypothetical protein